MKTKTKKQVLIAIQKKEGKRENKEEGKGGNHPPKNKRVVKKDIRIICEYSARKKAAKLIAEYSTLNPETNSDSPSVKSNGARFVSANAEIKNITKAGKTGKKNQMSC